MSDERNAHLVGPEAGLAKSGPASASARWALACRRLLTGWWWPTVLMLGLSLWRIGTPAAWNDELATWGAVREPWDNLLALSWHSDAVITPYYLVLHLWALAFGTSDAALRIPSAMAIVVACALVTRLGIRLHSRHAGIVAGLLFALTPSMSRVAQEARVYAFVIMFAALATLLLLRVLERPSAAWLTAYGVSVAALGLAHLMGLFLLLAHAGAVVAAWILASPPGPKPPGSRPPGPKPPAPKPLTLTWRWAAACVVGCLPAVPLALAGRSQSGQIGWIPPSSAGALLDLVTGLTRSTAVGGLVVGLAIAHRLHRRAGVLVLGWAVLPVAGLFAAGLVFPVFLSRYLLFVLPAWLLLGATAVARPPAWRPAVLVLVVALLGLPAQLEIRASDGHGYATRDAVAAIAEQRQPGDVIVYALWESTGSWTARDAMARYVPPDRRPRDIFAVRPQRTDGQRSARECADLEACFDDPPRVWVLRHGSFGDPLLGLGEAKERLLRERYTMAFVHQYRGMTVALLVPPG